MSDGVVEYEWDGLNWIPMFASDTVITPPPPPPPAANVGPTATFTATPGAGRTMLFDASASSDSDGTIASYDWVFGDGGTDTGPNPTHTYATGGTYGVTLTVTDNDGASSTDSHTVTVNSVNASPLANFTYTSSALAVSFDGRASSDPDGTITKYAWNFGDSAVDPNGIPNWDHVVVVIMENHTATEIMNSSSATYIRQLASTGVNFTQSFALAADRHLR
jgi:PKD repeat protein